MKKQTKKEKVLNLLLIGMKPKDIAAKLKIKTQQVYAIKSEAKKKMQLPGQVVFVKKSPIDDIKFMMQTGCVTYRTETPKQEKTFFQKFKEFMGL